MAKAKFYTVWKGCIPGVYSSWIECRKQVHGFEGAVYKSFNTKEEAEAAFNSNPSSYVGASGRITTSAKRVVQRSGSEKHETVKPLPLGVTEVSLAVDAACSGNPGKMEYRGVYLVNRREIFHYGPVYGTNNIGEFLAIVHALALLKQKNLEMPVYSDSRIAIGWVKQKKCKTNLPRNEKTEDLFSMISRAEDWLKCNVYSNSILKWETDKWGEIPADFGRK